jgi:hypothetical protein
MNERIQQLAEQATETVKCGLNGTSTTESFNRKKFAELIVRECAKIADDGYGSDHFGNGIAGYQLLEHFGVEL